jgi:hypothetical protein
MPFWNKVRCALGLHHWTPWTYGQSHSCSQTRHCERCGKRHSRVEHSWSTWSYVSKRKCNQIRSCTRCGAEEHGIEHAPRPWASKAPDSCSKIRFCQRCGEGEQWVPDDSPTDHGLSPRDLPRVNCQRRSGPCPRCGQLLSFRLSSPEHDWGPWRRNADGHERTCRFCGESEVEPP